MVGSFISIQQLKLGASYQYLLFKTKTHRSECHQQDENVLVASSLGQFVAKCITTLDVLAKVNVTLPYFGVLEL